MRLAELVLTLNNLSFDGEHYQQISGVAIGTKIGSNYANFLFGYVEQIFERYNSPLPDFCSQFIDDCLGTASCPRTELECFIDFFNNFPPNIPVHMGDQRDQCEIDNSSLNFARICFCSSLSVTRYFGFAFSEKWLEL